MSNPNRGSIFDRRKAQHGADRQDNEPVHVVPPPVEAVEQEAAPETDASGKQPYKAMLQIKAKPGARIRLVNGKGHVRIRSYALLSDIVCTSHKFLSLVFSGDAVVLEGRHLDRLLDALEEERARALTCFHAGRHLEPEAGEPVIESMELKSFRDLTADGQS